MNNDLFTRQREYATSEYLKQADANGHDHSESERMIKMFWEYVNKYPMYQAECEKKQNKSLYNVPCIDLSKHPDYDYASRYSGIDADYIYSLVVYFSRFIWKSE